MHQAPARKSLGQHFLTDRRYLAPILEAAELTPPDIVLEIGPGRGVLTEALAVRVGCLVAVELDHRLIEPLRQRFAGQSHVHIVHGDILEHAPGRLVATACLTKVRAERSESDAPERLQPEKTSSQASALQTPPAYKVVANLPYYITSAVLRHLLEAEQSPSLAVLMVQWEVARRICASPGEMSLLAVSVQYYAEPRVVQRVPAKAFSPKPKVDSAILQLRVRSRPAVDVAPDRFFRVVRAGFSQKRKQLINTLAAGLHIDKGEIQRWLKEAGIDPTRRAETLTLSEWEKVCQQARL